VQKEKGGGKAPKRRRDEKEGGEKKKRERGKRERKEGEKNLQDFTCTRPRYIKKGGGRKKGKGSWRLTILSFYHSSYLPSLIL